MKTKTCNTCKNDLPIDHFDTNGWTDKTRRKRKYHAHCKKCISVSVATNYYNRVVEALGDVPLCCVSCGYDEHFECLDLHHVDPKTKDVSALRGSSLKRIKKEVDKCIILCAICHRLVHSGKINITNAKIL